MKLYLMRHGDYVMDMAQQMDVLSETGKNDIGKMADFLTRFNLRVSNILHSEKFRAKQTAELIAQGVTSAEAPQPHSGLQPNDEVAAFANEINQWREDTLVVGHLPFMGRLVSQLLVGNEYKEIVDFQTGTLVCLEQIEQDRWLLNWVLTPSLFQ